MVFTGQVDGLVVRHDQMGAFAHLDSAGADVDALAVEIVHFLDQHRRVDHHAVADQAGLALQDTGGHQVADELFTIDDHRVPCIVAALKTDDNICTCSQKIDDFALALITPLRSDDNGVRQISLLNKKRIKDSRVQGPKIFFSKDFIKALSILSTSPMSR
jgi:hypothetical protein